MTSLKCHVYDKNMLYFYCVTQCFSLSLITHNLSLQYFSHTYFWNLYKTAQILFSFSNGPTDILTILWNHFVVLFTLAIASMFADGSDPVESRHTKGILLSDSSSMASRSRTELSRYSAPRESKMYLRAWERVRSGHHARISRSLRKTSSAT